MEAPNVLMSDWRSSRSELSSDAAENCRFGCRHATWLVALTADGSCDSLLPDRELVLVCESRFGLTVTYNHKICAACDTDALSPLADLGIALLERCRNCGLVMNTPVGSTMARDYYGEDYDGLYENYYRNFRQKQFRDALHRLQAVVFPSKRVLDVGCSYGWFLKAAKAQGFDPVGAEPSEKVFGKVTANEPFEIYNCGIEGIPRINGTFGLITMWNVFEHLKEPRIALDLAHAKLDTQGVLLICVPDFSGLITRMAFLAHTLTLGKLRRHLLSLYQMDNDFPHLFHYSRKSLETMLRKNRFEPFLAWGQDIVDTDNVGERIHAYAGRNAALKYGLAMTITSVQKLARVVRMQDELVVLARKT